MDNFGWSWTTLDNNLNNFFNEEYFFISSIFYLISFHFLQVLVITVWLYSTMWGILVHYNPHSSTLDAITSVDGQCRHVQPRPFYILTYIVNFYVPSTIVAVLYVVQVCSANKGMIYDILRLFRSRSLTGSQS